MPAGVYLLGESAYRKGLRASRQALGLCRFCSLKAAPGFKSCQRHLDYDRQWKARQKGRAA